MKKTFTPKQTISNSKQIKSQLKPVFYILMMAYLIIPTFLPGFETLDTNGPKFLAIAILNLISLIVFLNDPDFRSRNEFRSGFFKSFIGIAYTLFLIISLLSIFKAINITESLVNFTRIFTVFSATYVLFVIFSSNRGYLLHLTIIISILLLIDSVTVFYNIIRYIGEEVTSIVDIKTMYSNKNVLASAIFLKLPFALFLIFFNKGWQNRLGYIAGFCAVFATLLLSTRAFYIGLVIQMAGLLTYSLIRYYLSKDKNYLYKIVHWAGLVIVAIIIYSVTQQYLFPKEKDVTWNAGIVTRMSSIKSDESSTEARLLNWERSLILIKENPFLGVGSGNWKVKVLKYENPLSSNFTYALKNHNDFLEITCETGIFGGLSFLAIFIFILYGFIKISLKSESGSESLKYLFIPAFGILAYSVDAFFNFPADRPEIQVLFSLFVALAIAYTLTYSSKQTDSKTVSGIILKNNKFSSNKLFAAGSLGLLSIAVWILIQLSVSLYYQLLARKDNFGNDYKHSSSFFLNGFPDIPNLTSLGEPIAVNKARYLIVEKKYKEAITLLKADHSSPFDSRCDYYISMAYDKMGMTDSAIYWGQKAYEKQPLHGNLVIALSSRLFLKGRNAEGLKILDTYLLKIKDKPEAWIMAAREHWQAGHTKKSIQLLDSAAVYFPADSVNKMQRTILYMKIAISPYEALYDKANIAFNSKKYSEAILLLNEFLAKKPEFAEAYSHRALCLFFTGRYYAGLLDIDKAFELGFEKNSNLLNLRGIINSKLDKNEAACLDFRNSMEKGNEQAKANYLKFCGGKLQ